MMEGGVMLEEVLKYCNRLRAGDDFVKAAYPGEYIIEGGSITPLILAEGQYFCIFGSDLNDGVYQYPAADLKDETFTGTVWALRLPPAFLALVEEMTAWQEKNGAAAAGPYASESFGGYSYSKATDATTGGAVTVWSAFSARLNQWRKI